MDGSLAQCIRTQNETQQDEAKNLLIASPNQGRAQGSQPLGADTVSGWLRGADMLACLLACFALLCFRGADMLACLLACFALLGFRGYACHENRASRGINPAKPPSVSADSWCVGEIGQRLDFRFPAEGNGAPGSGGRPEVGPNRPFSPHPQGGVSPGNEKGPPPPSSVPHITNAVLGQASHRIPIFNENLPCSAHIIRALMHDRSGACSIGSHRNIHAIQTNVYNMRFSQWLHRKDVK